MVTVDCWKVARENEETVTDFADILAASLIKDAREMEDNNHDEGTVPTCITKTTDSSETTPSSLSTENRLHTMQLQKTQLRCLWCSRVNLLHRKTFLKCKECKKGFCYNGCWSHHVTFGGVPNAPIRGTKKMKVKSDEVFN